MAKSILFFGASAIGLIQLRLDLMNEFRRLGYKVAACAFLDDNAEYVRGKLKGLGIEFVAIKLNKAGLNVFNDFFSLIDLYRALKRIRPGIVYLYHMKPVIYGSIASKLLGVSRIYSTIAGAGSIFIGNSITIKIIRVLVKLLYRIALFYNKKVFFQNPDDLDLFITEGIVKREKTNLVNGSGVDLNYYQLADLPKAAAFIMVSRLIRDKGVREYALASEALKSKYPKTKFYLMGSLDSNPTSLSKKDLNYLVAKKIISYIDGASDVRKAIKKASVFVLPSYGEGTSRATLEAMSMGRPIITTNAPGCRETVIDGANGYLVPVRNSKALEDAMEKFILYPRVTQKMGKESRKIAEAKYDVKKVNKDILKFMGQIN
jgi:glycosyltransferase involved in cell wall biosynthesis